MSDFSLITTVRSVIESTDLASPQEIADKVVEMVPRAAMRSALVEAMPFVVQAELSRQTRPSTAPSIEPARRTQNPSAKVRALRRHAEEWRARLRHRISVGGGEWKFLADCSATDFRTAAARRRAHAAGALANAVEFETYATALDEHKASRFADLPETVQAQLLGAEESAA